jgi:hypothetical protein
MNNFLTVFGGEAFLAAIVAIHWMYLRAFFSRDTLLIIELPLLRSPAVEYSAILSQTSGSMAHGTNIRSPSVNDPRDDEATGDPEFESAAVAIAVCSHRDDGSVAASAAMVGRCDMPPGTANRRQSRTPQGFGVRERLADRIIIDERRLVLDGVIAETALICRGDVEVRAGALVGASMKVRGNLHAEANVTFLGPVVVNGDVNTGAGCAFLFNVVAKGRVAVGKGTRFGGNASPTKLV